ncbi:SDR family NAD(P)-dependent oxidoreductase [uncultured Victivallis sp.]|uniref:SDR family NAD(P)-dependent oxidoreductase n=1 Tax=uncultured Victivallis sp. TaxID=354118 RepID=UPI0025E5F924|nr:SDR family NAD(P)-dependent oxidoreductase [uncultured Victivallis sp.]
MAGSIEAMFRLDGRTALVTGSSRGIGREIARTLSLAGASVLVHGSRESEALREAAEECGAVPVIGDLSSPEGVESLIGACRAAVPSLDILVLNASVQKYVELGEFDESEFLREFQANTAASFRLIEAFSPAMRERRWGRIVTVGSVNQLRPSPRLTLYSATKSAQMSLTTNFAKTLAPHGVTVNCLVPGVILTDRNTEALKDPVYREKVRSQVPCGFFGETRDCAGAALLLASEAGRYITGIELPVTGGMHL